VSMGMAEMGVALGTVMSFLISAPLCNFIVLAMIYATFGFKITSCYLIITLTAAILGGWAISKTPWKDEIKRGDELENKKQPSCSATAKPQCGEAPAVVKQSATQSSCCAPKVDSCGAATLESTTTLLDPNKTRNALSFALALFKKIIPYVLLGSLISGLSAAYLSPDLVEQYVGGDNIFSIIVAAVIGVPLYLRIEMAIPLLNVLIVKGMGIGPAMALVIGGTGASLPEIALVSAVLKPKAVCAFVGIIVSTAIIGGLLFQYVI